VHLNLKLEVIQFVEVRKGFIKYLNQGAGAGVNPEFTIIY